MAVAALILGILAVVADILPFGSFAGWFIGLVAMILGIVARKKAQSENVPTGMATAGMALGITGLALGVLMAGSCMYCIKAGGDMNREMEQQRRSDPSFRRGSDNFMNAATHPEADGKKPPEDFLNRALDADNPPKSANPAEKKAVAPK